MIRASEPTVKVFIDNNSPMKVYESVAELLASAAERTADAHAARAADAPDEHRCIAECTCPVAHEYRTLKAWRNGLRAHQPDWNKDNAATLMTRIAQEIGRLRWGLLCDVDERSLRPESEQLFLSALAALDLGVSQLKLAKLAVEAGK